MKFHGNIELNNNELQQAAMEDEANFPASPPKGRIIFREGRVFIAVDIVGSVTWVPMTNVIDTHIHLQASASDTWAINHDLNSASPLIQIYEEGSQIMFFPDDVTIIDNNNLTVTLGAPASGRCIIMAGDLTSNSGPAYSFTHEQTTGLTAWVVVHGLGYSPLVRVFVGNEEVQPLSIVHDSITQTTITFSAPTIGVARFI